MTVVIDFIDLLLLSIGILLIAPAVFEVLINSTRNRKSKHLTRCKDCKYSSPNQVYGCRIHSFADDLDERMYSDDFCSKSERKDKNGKQSN